MEPGKYLIDDLCALTGFSRRTVRYYVQTGLIDPPAGRGRGGYYSEEHLSRLLRIRSLQEQGVRFSALAGRLGAGGEGTVASGAAVVDADEVPREPWARYPVTDGLEVHVARGFEERHRIALREALRVFRSLMEEGGRRNG
jgi:DNA-binding transcriptional MerR regulator